MRRLLALLVGLLLAPSAHAAIIDVTFGGTIDTVSYGKERPVCRQSTEDCWARNRRDDFVINR